MIFQDALDSQACQDFRMDQGVSSIYYKEPPDNNLYFSLLFESKGDAHAFQNKMLNYLTSLFKRKKKKKKRLLKLKSIDSNQQIFPS
jgi:hypothetical protein